jgi:hypothetical protein
MTMASLTSLRSRLALIAGAMLLAQSWTLPPAGASPAPSPLEPEKCVFENPNLWSLRFNLSPSLTVDQCHTQCLQGGGNGYLCLSAVSGLCLCGTSAKPSSSSPPTTGCTATCAGSDDPCGGPMSRYTCYVAAAATATPTDTPTATPTVTPTQLPAAAPALAPAPLAAGLVVLAVIAATAMRRRPNV